MKDAACYMVEAEDTSLSFDIQEKSSCFQFKVFSLEACERTEAGSVAQRMRMEKTPFTKLFSSSSSVLSECVSEVVEEISPLSSSLPPHSPSLSNFLTVDMVTHQQVHRPTEVCLRVQSFEAVVWLDFFKCLLELVAAVGERSVVFGNREEKEESKEVRERERKRERERESLHTFSSQRWRDGI